MSTEKNEGSFYGGIGAGRQGRRRIVSFLPLEVRKLLRDVPQPLLLPQVGLGLEHAAMIMGRSLGRIMRILKILPSLRPEIGMIDPPAVLGPVGVIREHLVLLIRGS